MNLKDFNELLILLEEKGKEHNFSYHEERPNYPKEINSPQYDDVIIFLSSNFGLLSNDLKIKIVNFLNDKFKTLFEEFWMKEFYIIRLLIWTYSELKELYYRYKFPFGFKDLDKYEKRKKSLIKKLIKNNKNLYLTNLSPYEIVKFLYLKSLELINMNNINHHFTVKRDIESYKKEICREIISLCLEDNYNKYYRNAMRTTKKQIETYENEFELFFKTRITKRGNNLPPDFSQ